TLLYVKGSIFGDNGQSSQLAAKFISNWQQKNPNGTVVVRDLATDVPPYLDAAVVGAFFTPADDRNDEQKAVVAYSDELIEEISSADEVLIGMPMYNSTVTAQMKSYPDHLCGAGFTFKYSDSGPVVLLSNKPVNIITVRGGNYNCTTPDLQT